MMRIISGIRRGKKLLTLSGDNTRPTLERVKQAFFNAIQFDIAGREVLDLFSGSGQLGLEALSRGATSCWFNDMSKDAVQVIEKNIIACGFEELSQLTCKSYTECVKMIKSKNFSPSLVFLDPPYGCGMVSESLRLFQEKKILLDDALIVCESGVDEMIDYDGYQFRKEYKYSDIKVTILQYKV